MKKRAVIALKGPLGAGKTTFVKGLAEKLGIRETVQSPTFTMLNEYHSGRIPLYHLDLYRLSESSPEQGEAIIEQLVFQLEEFIHQDMVCVIEWSELFKASVNYSSYLDELDYLEIQLSYGLSSSGKVDIEDEAGRIATFRSCGEDSARVIALVVGKSDEWQR